MNPPRSNVIPTPPPQRKQLHNRGRRQPHAQITADGLARRRHLAAPLQHLPPAVTIFTSSTISSIFLYRFFFIPLAFVAIHPPSVKNSTLSSSCPIVNPYAATSVET
jgi:hypothetical protein